MFKSKQTQYRDGFAMASRALLLRNIYTAKQLDYLLSLNNDQQLEVLLPGKKYSAPYKEGALDAIAQYRFVFERILQAKLIVEFAGRHSVTIAAREETDEGAISFGQCE